MRITFYLALALLAIAVLAVVREHYAAALVWNALGLSTWGVAEWQLRH